MELFHFGTPRLPLPSFGMYGTQGSYGRYLSVSTANKGVSVQRSRSIWLKTRTWLRRKCRELDSGVGNKTPGIAATSDSSQQKVVNWDAINEVKREVLDFRLLRAQNSPVRKPLGLGEKRWPNAPVVFLYQMDRGSAAEVKNWRRRTLILCSWRLISASGNQRLRYMTPSSRNGGKNVSGRKTSREGQAKKRKARRSANGTECVGRKETIPQPRMDLQPG